MRRRAALAAAALLALASAGAPAARAERESTCVTCHADEEEETLSDPVEEWRRSVHAAHEVSCDGCHGGDPRKSDADASMSEKAGFMEVPSWRDAAAHCGVCHESLAEAWLEGAPGRAIREGKRPATCFDCHMSEGHRVREAGPRQLDYTESCPYCAPLGAGEDAERSLRANRKAVRAVFEQIERVEAKGLELGDLIAELAALYRAHGVALHRFEPGGIGRAGETLRPALTELTARAEALEAEADRRRRFGALVLVPVGALVLGLLLLPRRPETEEE